MKENKIAQGDQPVAPRRILVAEDDAHVRRLIATVLAGAGYSVHTAEDGGGAWDALQRNHYELLITDYEMPGLSGIALITKIRAAGMALPVILMSGTMPTEQLRMLPALRLGGTLHKPNGIAELLKTVQEVLAGAGASPVGPRL